MSNQNPEQKARDTIDGMLEASGWSAQAIKCIINDVADYQEIEKADEPASVLLERIRAGREAGSSAPKVKKKTASSRG